MSNTENVNFEDTEIGLLLYGNEKKDIPSLNFKDLRSKLTSIFKLGNTTQNSSISTTKPIRLIKLVKDLLFVFVQENYTGPPLDVTNEEIKQFFDVVENLPCANWDADVILDGESIVENIKYTKLVIAAEHILQLPIVNDLPSAYWWKIRTYFLHQSFLEEKSKVLWDLIKNEISQLLDNLIWEEEEADRGQQKNAQATLCVELSEIYSFYYDVETAKKYMAKAKEVLGLTVNTTGLLGKRTKFQQNTVAQLVLDVSISNYKQSSKTLYSENPMFPTNVKLEDEDRLEKLELNESVGIQAEDLLPIHHLVILGDFHLKRKYLPNDGVYLEELLSYITFLVECPKIWSIQMVSLLHRSVLEGTNRRTVERSMKQLEVLHKAVSSNHPFQSERVRYFFGSCMPTKYEIDVCLSQVLCSLHLFKEALDISLRLNRWEDVINCYTLLNLRHKAEDVIRQQLEVAPSTKLWILLGDATDNTEYYQTAWDFSGQKSARAQRQWGYYHFVRKQYVQAIPFLQKSLELSPLESPTWTRLGYSALMTENWLLSTKAYQHSSMLDGDNFEIWNNLARGFVELGEKEKALRALKEASKCNFENWKVWENTLIVATDCKAFGDAIRAYNRLIDLKGKWVDDHVLVLLVRGIITNVLDADLQPSMQRHYKDILKLFGRITSQVVNNSTLWKLYSDLLFVEPWNPANDYFTTWSKALSYAQKSVECGLSDTTWTREMDSISELVNLTVEFIGRIKDFEVKFPEQSTQWKTQAEFTVKRVYLGIKKAHDSAISQDKFKTYMLDLEKNAKDQINLSLM